MNRRGRTVALPHPALTINDIPFTTAYFDKLMKQTAGIYDATDPDLRAFRADGGKLLLWQGAGGARHLSGRHHRLLPGGAELHGRRGADDGLRPLIAADTTGGPVTQASSYTPQQPPVSFDANMKWAGTFSPGYERVCRWAGEVGLPPWQSRPALADTGFVDTSQITFDQAYQFRRIAR